MKMGRVMRDQERELRRLEVKAITDADGVPIEACFVLVIHPDDAYEARALLEFVPRDRYPPACGPCLKGEMGRSGVARIVVGDAARGAPRLYGRGDRTFRVET